ncbi:MAG: penicillin-binding protein activator LpoB [Myxococcales bacterium]|jgi:uncharacterized protein (TIGR02722 family)|nr:penicillin-binding protein activator LpoB [Myxococcales bacterium]
MTRTPSNCRPFFAMFAASIALAILASACAPAVRVTRTDPEEETDLSGRWNDTDARLVAEQMIQEALAHPWSDQARLELRRTPVVIVQLVRNRSLEHIDTSSFIQELQRALIDSGRIGFVASAAEREQLRAERRDQDLNATEQTRKSMGNEIGADYALSGEINATLDRSGGTSIMSYQITLKLTHIETSQIVWSSVKRIKKQIQRAGMTW